MDVADWQAPVSPPQELWVAMAWDGYEGAFVGYVRYDALQVSRYTNQLLAYSLRHICFNCVATPLLGCICVGPAHPIGV